MILKTVMNCIQNMLKKKTYISISVSLPNFSINNYLN